MTNTAFALASRLGDTETTDSSSRPRLGEQPAVKPLDLSTLLDGMREGFALLDSNFIILDVNAEMMRLESRSRDEIIGRSHWDVFPGSAQSELGMLYKRAVRERVPVALEHRHVWEDGRVSWLDMRAYPVGDGQLAIFFQDVTDRRAAERALRDSEQRFRGAVAAFTDALWTNDADGRMMGEQPGWAALTGQSREDYQGFGWSSAVHHEDAQRTLEAWTLSVAERRPFVFEHRVRTRSGIWRHFSVRAVPVFADDGTIREWVGVHRDITENTEAGLQLQRALDDKDVLLREIDHRVRNSLTIVASMLSMQGGASQSAEVRQALTVAAARMQAVARIHERLYKGKTLGVIRLDEYIAQICTDLQESLAGEGVRLEIDTIPVQMSVDHAIPLGLVTNELVTNAFKHCRGEQIVIRVTLATVANGYTLTVADDGAGMPADYVAGSGKGLGMRVVNLLTRQVGGTLEFPAPGEAAHFRVFIPQRIVTAGID